MARIYYRPGPPFRWPSFPWPWVSRRRYDRDLAYARNAYEREKAHRIALQCALDFLGTLRKKSHSGGGSSAPP